ncbi:MAG: tetratricopeptide repeat protein [bacterium]
MKMDCWQIDRLLDRLSLNYIEQPGEVSRWKEKIVGSLQGNEKSHELWFLLGSICYIEGDFERAAECFTNCVNLDPFNAQYHKNLAFALRQMGRYGEFDDIIFDKLPNLKK